MREERRREIEKQVREGKKAKKNGFFVFVAVAFMISFSIFTMFLLKLKVMPLKYLLAGAFVMSVIILFTVPVLVSRRGKRGRKIGAAIVSIILVGAFGYGTYNLASTSAFFERITVAALPTEDYHVVIRAEDMPAETDADGNEIEYVEEELLYLISGTTVGTVMSDDLKYSEAKALLQDKVDIEYRYIQGNIETIKYLTDKKTDAVFMPADRYEALKASEEKTLIESTAVLYTLKIPIEVEDKTSGVDVKKESFNIYISGTDHDGYRSDVNMIATVNPVTHEVLLTSLPRDLYVKLPTKNAYDKLTHSRIYGLQETIGAVEDAFNLDINYYVSVNYSSLKGIVDAIGGIEVESKYDFWTSGMGRLNGKHFVVGTNKLDGDGALAFSRERHSFPSGDMTRNENQQAVLEAILKKASSSTTILNSYADILSAVSNNIETNMSADDMATIIREQISGMPSWKIKKQAVKGEISFGICYALGMNASVVLQVEEEDAKALDKIVKVMVGS